MKLQVQVQQTWQALSSRERKIHSLVRQGIAGRRAACAVQDRPGVGPGEFSRGCGPIAHGGILLWCTT